MSGQVFETIGQNRARLARCHGRIDA